MKTVTISIFHLADECADDTLFSSLMSSLRRDLDTDALRATGAVVTIVAKSSTLGCRLAIGIRCPDDAARPMLDSLAAAYSGTHYYERRKRA